MPLPQPQSAHFQIIAQDFKARVEDPFTRVSAGSSLMDTRQIALEARRYLATGTQVRSEVKSSERTVAFWTVPATIWDLMKQAIVEWQPTLKFGWLVPQMKMLDRTIQVTEHAKYMNVFPVPAQLAETQRDLQLGHIRPPEITPYQWLTAKPFTREEFEGSRRGWEEELASQYCAAYLAYHDIKQRHAWNYPT